MVLRLTFKSGFWVAVFRADSYMYCGKYPITSEDVVLTKVLIFMSRVLESAS